MQENASRTAVLVCQGRAVAHGRIAPGRFDDPTAAAMLGDDELAAVEQVRTGAPAQGFGARVEFEMLRANAEVMVPRTVAIDDAVRARPTSQVVLLGAGLDGRAWRMSELGGADVFEVDHPASQEDKQRRVGDLRSVTRSLHFAPLDFTRGSLDDALARAGHRTEVATTWIWEGVVPYLTRTEVGATVRVVSSRSAAGSRLVVNYQSPSAVAAIGRLLSRVLAVIGRRQDPLKGEPRRSAWTAEAMRELLSANGWTVAHDDDLLTLARQLDMEVHQPASLRGGRVAVVDR